MEGRQAVSIGGITQNSRSVKNRAQKMVMGKPASEKHAGRVRSAAYGRADAALGDQHLRKSEDWL